MGEETRYDLWLKRLNTWIAILGGSVASVAGVYNFYPSFFPAAPGNISAVVRAHGGGPVSRAHVELLTSENILLSASDTDRQGRYVKKDVEPGSYRLKVSRGGFEPQMAKVRVAPKKTTDVELVLSVRNRNQAPAISQAPANPQPVTSPQAQAIPPAHLDPQAQGNAIRSALEETGASWIRSLGNPGK